MPEIVVGVDDSAHAYKALDWAMREAGMRHAAVTVMTVIPTMAHPWTGEPLTAPGTEEAIRRAEQTADEAVAKFASDIAGPQPESVSVKVFTGFPAQALVDASREADLVVVGSRGGGSFTRLVLGPVSGEVAHHAACPVVIVPFSR